MPPIESGPIGLPAARAVGAVDARSVRSAAGVKDHQTGPVASDTARAHASANSAVMRSAALDPGPAPVDAERVTQIRKAIETGSYPVIPMRVADAMIAAGMLLRSGQ